MKKPIESLFQGGLTMINPSYVQPDLMDQISHHFQRGKPQTITLQDFFTDAFLKQLHQDIISLHFQRIDNPISRKCDIAKFDNTSLLENEVLLKMLGDLIGKNVERISGNALKFSHKDYIILHDDDLPEPGYDLIIDLTEQWNNEFGGTLVYTDGEGTTVDIVPNYGSISVVQRTENLHYYVKYVNHHAQQLPRYLVIAEIFVET